MRLNMDRICQLAGIPSNRGGLLRESADYNEGAPMAPDQPLDEESLEEMDLDGTLREDEKEDPLDEIVEIDEVELVQELRRAKRLMNESRKREAKRKQKLQEMQLRAVIDQEVKNIIKDMQFNSGWVYGNKKPTRSRKGYTHQGSYLKGIGFK